MNYEEYYILDGAGQEVRLYNTKDHGRACEEQGITLKQMAEGFCEKNSHKGFHIAGTKGGKLEVKSDEVNTGEDEPEDKEPGETGENEDTGEEEVKEEDENEEGEDEDTEEINLGKMTVAELKEFAKENKVDLGEATKKDDIIAVIEAKMS